MSLEKLEECKNIIEDISNYKNIRAYVLKIHNKKKGLGDYFSYRLKFNDNALKILSLELVNCYINLVKSKGKPFLEYDGFNNKNSVDKISLNHDDIKNHWNEIENAITNCKEKLTSDLKTSDAFIIKVKYKTDKENKKIDNYIYLMSKMSIPHILKNSNKFFSFEKNTYEISVSDDNCIRFPKTIDTIIYENVTYNINHNFEDIFNLENSIKTHCNNCINQLIDLKIIDEENLCKIKSENLQIAKKFINFSTDKIMLLLDNDVKTKIKQKFDIDFNNEKCTYVLNDNKKAKIFTDLICNKVAQDLFNEDLYQISSYKKIN